MKIPFIPVFVGLPVSMDCNEFSAFVVLQVSHFVLLMCIQYLVDL